MESDRERWDTRYAGAAAPVAAPPEAVATWPDLDAELPHAGRALDVACGTGAPSLWLAQRGMHVISLDVSPRAIALLDAAAGSDGLADRVDARVFDTDLGLPDDAVDLAVIICQRYRAPTLYEEFVERLAPGGHLCITVLSTVGLEGEPGPFHAVAGELVSAFASLPDADVVRDVERSGVASIVVRRRVD